MDEDEVEGRRTPPGTRDIALPHHTDEVSHIAVDVSFSMPLFSVRVFCSFD